MKFKWAVAVLVLLMLMAGCASGRIGIHAGNSSSMRSGAPPPGSSYSSAAIRAEGSPNAYIGVLFLGSVMHGTRDEYQRWRGGAYWRQPPEMAAGRAIAERDCSQPLGQIEGNLRCR